MSKIKCAQWLFQFKDCSLFWSSTLPNCWYWNILAFMKIDHVWFFWGVGGYIRNAFTRKKHKIYRSLLGPHFFFFSEILLVYEPIQDRYWLILTVVYIVPFRSFSWDQRLVSGDCINLSLTWPWSTMRSVTVCAEGTPEDNASPHAAFARQCSAAAGSVIELMRYRHP